MTDHIHMANPPKPVPVYRPRELTTLESLFLATLEITELRKSHSNPRITVLAFFAGVVIGALVMWWF